MAIDWNGIEGKLVSAARKSIAAFAKQHAGTTFFGAIFVIEPFDGVFVKIALDTPEHLRERAGANADQPHYKWLLGDFRHTIEVSKQVAGWTKIDDAIVAATEGDMEDDATSKDGMWKTTAELVDAVCRVALRLDADGAFAALSRTADFALAVSADRMEPGDMSLARFAAFRKRAAKAKPAKRAPKKQPTGRARRGT